MKILYVTPMWEAVADAMTNGEETKGMPGFYRPVKKMTELGHQVEIYFICFSPESERLIKKIGSIHTLYNAKIVGWTCFQKASRIRLLWQEARLYGTISKDMKRILADKQYDFVYAQSRYSLGAIITANQLGVACGIREYGVSVRTLGLRERMRNLFSYLEYRANANFMLITDDGTKGVEAHKIFAGKKPVHDFYYWKSGVEINDPTAEELAEVADSLQYPALIHVARIAGWKRQDRSIEILDKLNHLGIKAHLYLVGQASMEQGSYPQQLREKCFALGLEQQVHFTGGVGKKQVAAYARCCTAALLMSDLSNLGNVFHELLANGAITVSIDDSDSLNEFIEQGNNGFLASDIEEAAMILTKIIKNEVDVEKIRMNARLTSCSKMCSWDERVDKEIALIKKAVEEGPRHARKKHGGRI